MARVARIRATRMSRGTSPSGRQLCPARGVSRGIAWREDQRQVSYLDHALHPRAVPYRYGERQRPAAIGTASVSAPPLAGT